METIQTTSGELLRLERNRISEIEVASGSAPNRLWVAYYSAIRKAYASNAKEIRVYETAGPLGVETPRGYFEEGEKTGFALLMDFSPATKNSNGQLGCKFIDYPNYRRLLRFIGASKTTRKARAAKAGA